MTVVLALGIAGIVVSGIGLLLVGLIHSLKKTAHTQGVQEERNAETQRSTEAKKRADEVLAESRDPDDVIVRLRDHEF